MSFKVSDKVVCVDDSPNPGHEWCHSRWVKRGVTYVIRGFARTLTDTGVLVTGITGALNPALNPPEECCWNPARFRKLSDIQAENAALRSKNVVGIVVSKNNQKAK